MAWVLDKAHTTIEFQVQHLLVSTVRGRFKAFDADVMLDLNAPARSRVMATVDADSLDTGNAERDLKVRSPDILDTAHYPTIKFSTTQVARMVGNVFWLRGNLTIRGVTRSALASGTFEGPFAGEDGTQVARFSFTIETNRSDFLNIPPAAGGLLIGNAVSITVNAAVIESLDAGIAAGTSTPLASTDG